MTSNKYSRILQYIKRQGLMLMPLLFVSIIVSAQSTLSQNQDGFNGETMDGYLDQQITKDTTVTERTVSKDYTQFYIDPTTEEIVYTKPDTLTHNFENSGFTSGPEGSYSFLSNLGSPRISRLYFERKQAEDFVFNAPFDYFLKTPSQFRFTDTHSPHLNITYHKGGDKTHGEEHIKGYFAANFNKRNGIGFDMDYAMGHGRYTDQATSLFDARFYTYHHGDIYSFHASFNTDQIKLEENGGIEDTRYITNPEAMAEGKKEYAPEDIPFRMTNTWNNIKHKEFQYAHSLTINNNFQITDSIGDSTFTYTENRHVSTVSHVLEISSLRRRYLYRNIPNNYYQNNFLSDDNVDLTDNIIISNSFNLSLLEGFSKWAIAGLSAYAKYEYKQFSMPDTLSSGRSSEYSRKYKEGNLYIGGVLAHEKGRNLSFRAQAETIIAGDVGDFNIDGDINLTFPFFKKEAILNAAISIRNTSPLFYQDNYHARDCWWDNEFNKEFATRLTGSLEIERLHTKIAVGVENITNYIYLTDEGSAVPISATANTYLHNIKYRQYSGSIQVASASLNQDFILGPLHWDNVITYQVSGDNKILPLPDLNIFSDLYLKFIYAKRLHIELGGSVTYFTEYEAPTYSPCVAQYHTQNSNNAILVGGYPLVNAYVNCMLRGVRFYIMCYHVNQGLMNNTNSFFVPGYPLNPRMIQAGISWTFFD